MMYVLTMEGYAVKITDILYLLKDDIRKRYKQSLDVYDTFQNILEETDTVLEWFVGTNGDFIFIPNQPPYKPLFNSKEEIDTYFFNKMKKYLKNNCTINEFVKHLRDSFDCEKY